MFICIGQGSRDRPFPTNHTDRTMQCVKAVHSRVGDLPSKIKPLFLCSTHLLLFTLHHDGVHRMNLNLIQKLILLGGGEGVVICCLSLKRKCATIVMQIVLFVTPRTLCINVFSRFCHVLCCLNKRK